MTRLATMTDEALHGAIYRLSCRRRAGDRSCDELLGKLLDEADRRGDAAGDDFEAEAGFEAEPAPGTHQDCAGRTQTTRRDP